MRTSKAVSTALGRLMSRLIYPLIALPISLFIFCVLVELQWLGNRFHWASAHRTGEPLARVEYLMWWINAMPIGFGRFFIAYRGTQAVMAHPGPDDMNSRPIRFRVERDGLSAGCLPMYVAGNNTHMQAPDGAPAPPTVQFTLKVLDPLAAAEIALRDGVTLSRETCFSQAGTPTPYLHSVARRVTAAVVAEMDAAGVHGNCDKATFGTVLEAAKARIAGDGTYAVLHLEPAAQHP